MSQDGPKTVPRHVAIIMDGNGRWAEKRGLPRVAGHRAGAEALRRTLEAAAKLGVEVLTVYAFSSENWRRSQEEISDLTALMRYYLERELKTLEKEKALSADDDKRAQEHLQKLTDTYVKQIDDIGHAKEAEVMEV